MSNETFAWIGGGIIAVIIYSIISNTIWLLILSKVVQLMPGVNIKGFRGTLKIATMILLSLIGTLNWAKKYIFYKLSINKTKPVLAIEIQTSIRQGALLFTQKK